MQFLYPTAIVGGTVQSNAQVVFHEVDQSVFIFMVTNCYVSVYHYSTIDENPSVTTAGFCVLLETKESCRITAIAIQGETLFAAASSGLTRNNGQKDGINSIHSPLKEGHSSSYLFAGSVTQLMRRYTTDPGTAGIAFLSPLPAELTLRIKEPIVLLRIVGLATPDSPDTSMRPSNADESQYSTVIAIVTQSGKFYYTYNNSPEICAVALKAPCTTIVECPRSTNISQLFLGGVEYVAMVSPFDGGSVRYIDLSQMSKQGDSTPIKIVSIVKYGRYIYVFSDDSRVLQVKLSDGKALRTLNRPIHVFTVLGVTQSSELFHCYGTNGVVRLLTCDTLKLYHKVTISSFKHLHYYSSSSIVAMHVSKSGICSVLEDSTIAIYKQESPSDEALKNPRSMLRSRAGAPSSGDGCASANTHARDSNTLVLASVFYGHTPFSDSIFLGESITYSYAQTPGNPCYLSIRGAEYGQVHFFDVFPHYINFFSLGELVIGFCTTAEATRIKLLAKADPLSTVCMVIYSINARKFILSYSFKKFTKVDLLTASFTPDDKLQIYFVVDGNIFYFRNLDVKQSAFHNIVPLCAKLPHLKAADAFTSIITPQVPNFCYCLTKMGSIYQVAFGTDIKTHTRTIFQPPQDVMDVFGVHISPNGKYLLVGITSMIDSSLKNSPTDSYLRSDVFIINIDRESTRILLKQNIVETLSLSEIPEGPNALAVGYLGRNSETLPRNGKNTSTRFANTVSSQGDLSDMIYAVFFKYKSLISIRSVILNKRIALVNSLQLDSSLHNHQLYINNYGNLIVYVANDKAIVKFSPLSVAAFHSSLQLQTSARSSTDDVPSSTDFVFGEGTYFDEADSGILLPRPISTELTIKLEATYTGINPGKHGISDHIQPSDRHSNWGAESLECALSAHNLSTKENGHTDDAQEQQDTMHNDSKYASLSEDSDLSNAVLEAYEYNMQTVNANQAPKLTETTLDSIFENVDILDEESVLKRLDSKEARQTLSESIILTMKDILLSNDSSPLAPDKGSAQNTPIMPSLASPPGSARQHSPPSQLPPITPKVKAAISPDVSARIKVGNLKPVIIFNENVGQITSAALPESKFETASSVQHIPQEKKEVEAGSLPTSPASKPEPEPEPSKEAKPIGTIFSPSGHDEFNNTIKPPGDSKAAGDAKRVIEAIDLSMSIKKSSTLLQSISAARMNIAAALAELENLREHCSEDEYASILTSAAPQLQEEAKHLSHVQYKVSTLATLHSSSSMLTSSAEASRITPHSPTNSVLSQYVDADGHIPASQFESILAQFGNNLIQSLKSLISRPSIESGEGAPSQSQQPQPLSGAALASVLQVPLSPKYPSKS